VLGANNNSTVTSLALCAPSGRLISSAGATDVSFTAQELSIQSSGNTLLGTIQAPIQGYERVELDVSPLCATSKSIRLTNASGSFGTTDSTTLRFQGQFEVSTSTQSVELSLQPIIDQLAGVASDPQIKQVVESTSGTISVRNSFTWTGAAGDANWNTGANWLGGNAPGAGDVAYFDQYCAPNCSVQISQAISIRGISIGTGYPGTITQSAEITLGDLGFTQISGNFVGGSSNFTVNGLFQLIGGSFVSTSGTLWEPCPPDPESSILSPHLTNFSAGRESGPMATQISYSDNLENGQFVFKPEAAQYLGISLATMDRLMQKREIAYYKPLGRVIFKKADLLRYIERNKSLNDGQQLLDQRL
jgi:excisionase family DNA binding protein